MKLHGSCLLAFSFLALPLLTPNASAGSIFGSDLDSFAVLGGAGVAFNGTGTTIVGSVGACCQAVAITGAIPTNFTISGGTVQQGGLTATSAQNQLGTAITALNNSGPGSVLSTSTFELGGHTFTPGIYSIGSAADLTGTLTLDGSGNPDALWVFLIGSGLTTASSSSVLLTNTGSGAGVFWSVLSSATLGSNSTFEGNILANQSITLDTNVTIPCGRLLTQVASVTFAGTDSIGGGCASLPASQGGGSGGLGGGGVITPGPGGPVVTAIPEPSAMVLLGCATVVLFGKGIRQAKLRLTKTT